MYTKDSLFACFWTYAVFLSISVGGAEDSHESPGVATKFQPNSAVCSATECRASCKSKFGDGECRQWSDHQKANQWADPALTKECTCFTRLNKAPNSGTRLGADPCSEVTFEETGCGAKADESCRVKNSTGEVAEECFNYCLNSKGKTSIGSCADDGCHCNESQ